MYYKKFIFILSDWRQADIRVEQGRQRDPDKEIVDQSPATPSLLCLCNGFDSAWHLSNQTFIHKTRKTSYK